MVFLREAKTLWTQRVITWERGVVGGTPYLPPSSLPLSSPSPQSDESSVLRLLETLEEAFVGAYLGALPFLEGEALRLAGAILGVEAGHRVLVRQARLAFQDPLLRPPFVANDRALERALLPQEAQEALKPYLP
ncbi:ferritin-like domain-containing protein [Thermus thermophilus]|uniref:ferritin-like domain-containing protein n=1 Tax=Thermus thermophilus TaxID=274 RepID=UPI001CC411D4|nr:ferritin-like domain-containing protein [Thermus thermophilus]